jgi:protein-disulfide isomerase
MTDAGRSLKTFYLVLGVIAVIGIALIVHAATSRPSAPLVMAECAGPPIGGVAPSGVSIGPDSAPVAITEFADFVCPSCARFAVLTMPDVLQRLIPTGKLKWQFLDFPLQQHANSPLAHIVAACAAAQGKFWQMEYALFDHQDAWFSDRNPERKFLDYARQVGLNPDTLRACMQERRPWPQIQANRCAGEKLGVNFTPTFFVNGRQLPETPAFDDLTRMVDSVVAATAARTPAKRR